MRWVLRFIYVSGLVTVALMVVILAVNVGMRYFLARPVTWAEEAGQLMLLWLTFLGAAAAARNGSHLRMSLLDKYLQGKAWQAYQLLVSAITIAVLFVISYMGAILAISNLERGSNYLPVSFAWFYAPIAVGGVLYSLFEIQRAVRVMRGMDADPDASAAGPTTGMAA